MDIKKKQLKLLQQRIYHAITDIEYTVLAAAEEFQEFNSNLFIEVLSPLAQVRALFDQTISTLESSIQKDMLIILKSTVSLAIFRSNVFDNQKHEWVLVAGYSNEGKFGYFVIKEYVEQHHYTYSDQYKFFPKQNEETYDQAIKCLQYVTSFKK